MIPAIDTFLRDSLDLQGPGMAVAIVQDGICQHCQGYGLANLEWSAPLTPTTVFRLASITKTFTATAILQLYQQGTVQLSDEIADLLPDSPASWKGITLEHLLSHTSGLKSYNDLDAFRTRWSRADLSPWELSRLFADLPLDSEPGTRFSYSNSNYVLLGLLLEQLTGSSYHDYIRTTIFAPLGMEHSFYMDDRAIILQRASGYFRTSEAYQHPPFRSVTTSYAAGGMGSTLEDLLIWENALRTNRLLSAELFKRATTPIRLADGSLSPYGLGWFVDTQMGQRLAYHPGGVEGFATFLGCFLDLPLSLILLTNCSDTDITSIALTLASMLF
jgi:CubicO group peptidase (beta-lactamase class C family)